MKTNVKKVKLWHEHKCVVNKCGKPHHRILRVGLKQSKWRYIPVCFEHYWHCYKEEMPKDSNVLNLKKGVEIGRIGKYIISGNLISIPYHKKFKIINIKIGE